MKACWVDFCPEMVEGEDGDHDMGVSSELHTRFDGAKVIFTDDRCMLEFYY